MSYFFAILQLLIIVIIIQREFSNKSPMVFLWATLLLMFSVPHCISVLFDDAKFSSSVMLEASVFVTCFSLFYLGTRSIMQRLKKTVLSSKLYILNLNSDRIVKLLFYGLLFVVFFKFYMIIKTVGSLFSSSWATGREIASSSDYLSFSSIVLSLYYPFSAVLLLSLINKKRKYVVLSSILIVICVLITRNRIEILPLLIGYILYFIYKGDRLSIKRISFFSIIGVLSIYLIYALLIFRHYGTFSDFVANFEFNDFNNRIFEKFSEGGELGLREVFYFFIDNDNQFRNFGQGHTYLRMLLVLVPTSFSFGVKPPDFAISMGSAYKPFLEGFSTHPTLFGDAYANFGLYGVFLGVFWAFFAFFSDRFIISIKNPLIRVMVLVSLCSSYIIIARGSVYNAFAIFVFGLIFIYLFSVLSKINFLRK